MTNSCAVKVFNLERWAGASTWDRARVLGPILRTTPSLLTVLDMIFAVAYPLADADGAERQEADWVRLRALIAGRDEDPGWREQAKPIFFRLKHDLWALVAETAVHPQEEVPMPPVLPEDIAQVELLMAAVGEALGFDEFAALKGLAH
jgi:hypothetical protein